MSQINAALASRAPATSEYERGRRDFAEQAAHMIDINRRPWDERTSTEIAEAIRTLAVTSGTPAPTPDWCDVCNASQMVVEDGEHVCGLTAYEAYSLGWRRGNNASHPLQYKPPAPAPGPKCSLEEATESVSKWPAWKREYSEQHPFLTSQD